MDSIDTGYATSCLLQLQRVRSGRHRWRNACFYIDVRAEHPASTLLRDNDRYIQKESKEKRKRTRSFASNSMVDASRK